jgi:tRNA threonylcarbamoyladenosine biosynthesis protein TsaE
MILANEAEMLAFGFALAARLKAGDWLAIDGPLGAGKTVLCSGILRGLGYQGEVASPSYALVHQYDPPDVKISVNHADLYRIDTADDFEELGLGDHRDDCITLVEWAKRGGDYFGEPSYQIEISAFEDGRRQLDMRVNDE